MWRKGQPADNALVLSSHLLPPALCWLMTLGCCMQIKIRDGKLDIVQEGRTRKFKQKVFEKTFGGASVCGRYALI